MRLLGGENPRGVQGMGLGLAQGSITPSTGPSSPSSLVILQVTLRPRSASLPHQVPTAAREFLPHRPAAGQRDSRGHPRDKHTPHPQKFPEETHRDPPSRQDRALPCSPRCPFPIPRGCRTSRSPGTKSRAEDALPRGQPSIIGKH